MARKSRKNTAVSVVPESVETKVFSTAIYVRLSVENSGKDDDGDSIENQTGICREYVDARPYLNLYGIYSDNGEKGWKFDRPEFTRMMDDVKAGKVDCIVVKDLSRFGRDYIETGNYLEKIFPFLGVRFISITDSYDSFTCDDAESALMVPLKNMVNDVYAKDISRKIITSFRQRQEKGDFLPGNTPYGYIKSETRQFRYEVDEKVAPYIRMLFEWKAEGVSHAEMARRLNEMGAVTPSMRKVELGIWHAEKYRHTVWGGRTLTDILTNPVYTGALVYGRMPKSLYEGIRVHRAPKEEWRILEGMHEPIVSRELFDRVQEIFEEHRKTIAEKYSKNEKNREGIDNRFRGRIVCGDCGKNMRFLRVQAKYRKGMYGIYTCGGYIDSRRARCSRHYIRASEVEDAVYAAIREQLAQAADMEETMARMKGGSGEKNRLDAFRARISRLMQEISKTNARRQGLYEDYVSGMLDEGEYQYARKEYEERAGRLNWELDEARKEMEQFQAVFSRDNRWLRKIRMADGAAELTDEIIGELVDEVRIFEDRRVEIVFKYTEDRKKLETVLAEMEEEHGDR